MTSFDLPAIERREREARRLLDESYDGVSLSAAFRAIAHLRDACDDIKALREALAEKTQRVDFYCGQATKAESCVASQEKEIAELKERLSEAEAKITMLRWGGIDMDHYWPGREAEKLAAAYDARHNVSQEAKPHGAE